MQIKEGMYIKACELGKLLGITDRHVRRLAGENVLKKNGQGKYYFLENIRAYIDYVSAMNDAPMDLKEKKLEVEIKKGQKDIELRDLKIREITNELHPAKVIEQVMTNMLANVKGRLMSMPNKIAPMVLGIENIGEIQEMIDTELRAILLEISEYDSEMFRTNEKYTDEDEDG